MKAQFIFSKSLWSPPSTKFLFCYILLKANVKTTGFDEVLLKATVNALLTHTQVGSINTK